MAQSGLTYRLLMFFLREKDAVNPNRPAPRRRLSVAGRSTVFGLRCTRTAVLSALAGGALLYLSMYVLTRGDGTAALCTGQPGRTLCRSALGLAHVGAGGRLGGSLLARL